MGIVGAGFLNRVPAVEQVLSYLPLLITVIITNIFSVVKLSIAVFIGVGTRARALGWRRGRI